MHGNEEETGEGTDSGRLSNMTFAEAIPHLLKLHQIRKPHFNEGHYVALDERNHSILTYFNKAGAVGPYEITDEDLEDTCWEVIE